MLGKAETLALLMNRKPNQSLAQPFYTDPAIFELDMQSIFYADWLFAIPACEIPKIARSRSSGSSSRG